MGCQPGLSADALFELVLGVAPGIAEVDKGASRECAGSLGRKRPFAVEGIVYIDAFSPGVGAHRDTAAKMADDEVELLIACFLAGGHG